ncbi:MAG TPA: hypothetical protein DDW54_03840 [Clostridiales bacterium]|nr:hypothetical protein [Clostridiales bacterium]
MNKFKKSVAAISLAALSITGVSACSGSVKTVGGLTSKIENCVITFDIGGTSTAEVNFELYLNYAPATIEHFKYLAGKGYYDGTIVSNAAESYFVEFGDYTADEKGDYVSKYGDAENGYYKYITESYAKGKTVGENRAAYRGDLLSLCGEFSGNGIYLGKNKKSNPLSLTGALVLKREKDGDDADNRNSARGGVAITLSSGGYYNSSNDFAVFGKVKDTADTDNVKKLVENNLKDGDGNSYYYYAYESGINDLGNYFMKDEEGNYFARTASGEYTVSLEDDAYEDLKKEFSEKSDYMLLIPRTQIKVVSIKFSK